MYGLPLLKLIIHESKGSINTSSNHFQYRFVHMDEAAKEYPQVQRVQQSPK